MSVKIEIDPGSGFCNGVVSAIRKAEAELEKGGILYCLGDIVHNSDEVERLRAKGLVTITHEQLRDLRNARVLLRAHGEPPSTYELARRNGIEIIDATCPVVLALQRRIKQCYDTRKDSCRIVIYGKTGHAEVNGLVGQTDGQAIVVESEADIDKIPTDRPIELYSQTTKSIGGATLHICGHRLPPQRHHDLADPRHHMPPGKQPRRQSAAIRTEPRCNPVCQRSKKQQRQDIVQ